MFISKSYNFDILAIDLLNIIFRFIAINKKEDTETLYNKISNNILYMKNILGISNIENIIFLTDYNFVDNKKENIKSNSSKSYIKSSFYTDYKTNRKYNISKENIIKIRNIVKKLSSTYKILYANGYEADDLAGYIYLNNINTNKKIAFYTTDKDWWQFINKNNKVVINKDKTITFIDLTYSYNKLNFYITQNNFILYKALFGDNSDNIKVSYNKNKQIQVRDYLIENYKNFYNRELSKSVEEEKEFLNSIIKYLIENNLVDKEKLDLNIKLITPLNINNENIKVIQI